MSSPEEKYRYESKLSALEHRVPLPQENIEAFEEVQHFDIAWIWALIGIETLVVMIPLIATGQPWWFLLMMASVMVLTMSMLSSLKLYTRIDAEGVHYRMNPFQRRSKIVYWDEIEIIQLRKLSGLKEFSGYGMRIGRKKRIYNLGGNQVIHIIRKDGKEILISTNKGKEVVRQLDIRPLTV